MWKRWIWSWVDWKRLGCGSRERNAHFSQTRLYTWDTRLTNMDFIQCKIRWREAILKPRSPENVQELQAFLVVLELLRKIPVQPVDRISAIAQIAMQGTEVVAGTATTAEVSKERRNSFYQRKCRRTMIRISP
ncbi:hypothetical protein NP493_6g09000 [Ridgeia piscesae]|uniref:Uncharacterized protein n=1 Tax=Ridgeia piscesae TaxID=27915 RepID=A0AAD9PFW1_RIDPI|nr:hypothetical protein NP493_6g09000 [Ridgeia piscesae]